MARPNEFTKILTGHVGYAVLPRPDVVRPETRVAWADNVWMGGEAGIATRRGGATFRGPTGLGGSLFAFLGALGIPRQPDIYTTSIMCSSGDPTTWRHCVNPYSPTPTWVEMSVVADVQTYASGYVEIGYFPEQVATLNNKAIFATVATMGNTTRLALWDPIRSSTAIRAAGFVTPGTMGAIFNEGGGSYAATLRYYRVRYTTQEDGVTIRRSEPSASSGFTPSGSGDSVAVTRPALIGEGETHWELEVSLDDATFYLLTTQTVATTVYLDSAATGTYSNGTLSEAIGARLPPPQCRSVVTDRDRFLFGGNWQPYASVPDYGTSNRVWYTPVLGTTDVADEECVPTDHYVDVAPDDEDEITALAGPLDDAIYVFKHRSIYRLTRTGIADAPYEVMRVATGVGARGPLNVTLGPDATGNQCLYFWDVTGRWRYGSGGLQRLDTDLSRAMIARESPSRVVYYAKRQAVLFGSFAYHVATGGWSRVTWTNINMATYVVGVQEASRNQETESQLFGAANALVGGKLYLLDDDTAATDDGTAFTARLGLTRMLADPGKRWVPTRCALWGTGGAPVDVSVTVEADPVTAEDTYDTSLVQLVGQAWLPADQKDASVVPLHLGTGPVRALGVWLADPTDATTAWRLDAVEISGQVQEPV